MSAASETHDPEATERAGAGLAATLRPGDVVLVSGELGAGKTTFVRGALRALGVTEAVTSPTFVVGILYDGAAGPSRISTCTGSRARRRGPRPARPYFGADTITFVEWPERAESVASSPAARSPRHVTLAHAGGDRRRIEVRGA